MTLFCNGIHVEGIAYLKQNKDFSKKVLAKYFRTSDTEYLEGAYAIFKEDFIAALYPITKGLDAIYEIAAARRPEIRNHKPEGFVEPASSRSWTKAGSSKGSTSRNRREERLSPIRGVD